MYIVKKISVMAYAKIAALVMLCFGLILTVLYAIGGGIFAGIMSSFPGADRFGGGVGAGLVGGLLGGITMTVLWTIFGFIGGAVSAWIYNFVASKVGGVELELEKKDLV